MNAKYFKTPFANGFTLNTHMRRIALVFQTTPGRLTVHITDQPGELIDELCEIHQYKIHYDCVRMAQVFDGSYNQGSIGCYIHAYNAIEYPDMWHIDAYWHDEVAGNWIDVLADFNAKASEYDRVTDADGALAVLYSLDV